MFEQKVMALLSEQDALEKALQGSKIYQNGEKLILALKNTESNQKIFDTLNITSDSSYFRNFTFLWSTNGKDFHILRRFESRSVTNEILAFYTSDVSYYDKEKQSLYCVLHISDAEVHVSDQTIEGIFREDKRGKGTYKSFCRIQDAELKQIATHVLHLLQNRSNLHLPKQRFESLKLFAIENKNDSYVLWTVRESEKFENVLIKLDNKEENLEVKEVKWPWFRVRGGSSTRILNSNHYSEFYYPGIMYLPKEKSYLILKNGSKLFLLPAEINESTLKKFKIELEPPIHYATPLDFLYPQLQNRYNKPMPQPIREKENPITLDDPIKRFQEVYKIEISNIAKNKHGEWKISFHKDFNEKREKQLVTQLSTDSIKGVTFQRILGQCTLIIPRNSVAAFEKRLSDGATIEIMTNQMKI